jgi:hypothetical protein
MALLHLKMSLCPKDIIILFLRNIVVMPYNLDVFTSKNYLSYVVKIGNFYVLDMPYEM